MRDKTRRERYEEKKPSAKTYPISIATVNFMHDGNLGYLIRSAACFGAQCVHVIGSVPHPRILRALSGTLTDYVQLKRHSNPTAFLEHTKENDIKLISAEINDVAVSIEKYRFDFDKPVCIVVGHEETGIPTEIIKQSDSVYIPMPGVGFCLNTSQAGNIMLYEAVKQYEAQSRFLEEWIEECYIHHP
jgi:tRNA G18 (ribose-2'-O)-methylase SpoU